MCPQVLILKNLGKELNSVESILTQKEGRDSPRVLSSDSARVGTLSARLPSAVCWSGCGAERARTQARIVDASSRSATRATVVQANARECAAAARDAHATIFRCALPTAVGLSPRLERLPAHSTPTALPSADTAPAAADSSAAVVRATDTHGDGSSLPALRPNAKDPSRRIWGSSRPRQAKTVPFLAF